MTPLTFMLVSALFCVTVWLLGTLAGRANFERRHEKRIDEYLTEIRDLREKFLSLLETGNARETYLMRAMEDLALAEIDRARFTLEVLYGKTKKS